MVQIELSNKMLIRIELIQLESTHDITYDLCIEISKTTPSLDGKIIFFVMVCGPSDKKFQV